MVEHHDVKEGVTSPRTLSGATALAILEVAALQRFPRPSWNVRQRKLRGSSSSINIGTTNIISITTITTERIY